MNTMIDADWARVGDWIIRVLGAAGGLIGTTLGLYNFYHARNKERRQRAHDEKDWQMYLELRAEMNRTGASDYTPDEGSDEHQWAERMVAKGRLGRGIGGAGYTMPSGS